MFSLLCLFIALGLCHLILSPTAFGQTTTFVLNDATTGTKISADSIRVVRARDGETWITTNNSIDLTVGVNEESSQVATMSVVDGRVSVHALDAPVHITLLTMQGREVEGMQPTPGTYVVKMESAFGTSHFLINTAFNSVQRVNGNTKAAASSIAATEQYLVTVFQGVFTSPQISVYADPSAGAKVNVAVPRPSWINRVVGVRVSCSRWFVEEALFVGKEQKPKDFSNLWSITKEYDSYELSSEGGFMGTACYTVGNTNGSRWEGAYVESGIVTEALTFDVVGAPVFDGNEVRFTSANTEEMRYYQFNSMTGHEDFDFVDGTFTFIVE